MRNETDRKIAILLFATLILLFFQLAILFLPPDSLRINDQLFFGNLGNNIVAISILSIAILSLLFFRKRLSFYSAFSVTLLLAGLTSNLTDRIFRGGAVDYLTFGNFPVFNLADIAIVASIALLLLAIGQKSSNKKCP